MIMKILWSVRGIALVIACWPGIAMAQSEVSERLNQILRKHEEQLARLSTLQASCSVTYGNDAEDPVSEHWQTTIAPGYERSKRTGPGSDISDQYLWNGLSFLRMLRFDPEEYLSDPRSITAVSGFLYHEDIPVHRLFQWRTLRAYRLYVDEVDKSLRELCEQSLREPELSTTNGLVNIQVVHPGSPPSDRPGSIGVPRGASILVDVDPAAGYLVRRYRTTFPLPNDGGHFSQELSVQTFKEFHGSLFLPNRVNFSATSGKHVMQQEIAIEYSGVNHPVDTDEPFFVENLLVKEFKREGDPQAVGFYLIRADRSLGEQFQSEQVASLVRFHRLSESDGPFAPGAKPLLVALAVGVAAIFCILLYKRRLRAQYFLPIGILAGAAILLWRGPDRDEILTSQIATLNSAPDVGSVAPPIEAVNLQSGESEEVELLGHVTLIEFWATWCGPCQHSMEKLNELASENGDRWESRVQLVTISVDADREAAETHLRARGWLSTRALIDTPILNRSPDDVGFPSVVARDYVVTGVPTCLLVDDRGEIVFRGNPGSVDFADEIERLLERGHGNGTVALRNRD